MQYLDYSALTLNALFFKKLLGNAKMCAVVKNDAYGHGIIHVARYLDSVVDCFAVGSVAEANQIKFVSKNILILLPQSYSDTLVAISNGFVLSLDSFETLDTILAASAKLGLKARVHIKIDSGMSRLGFKHNEIDNLVNCIQASPNIVIEGVYSHFYGENTSDCNKQLDAFLPCVDRIERALNRRLIKHISNSSGALLSSGYHLDMARIGLGLYGYGNENLVPVKKVTANVIAVNQIKAGALVGYGAKYVAPCDGRIAVLGVGYAQGFSRSLVNSYVLLNGAKCKVAAVCMAMIMIDVSDVDAKVGDAVTILGDGINISNDIVSIYELLCNLK